MKNSADQGGCYTQRPKAEVDNTLRVLQNSSYPSKAEFNNCFIIYSTYFPVLNKEFCHFALCFSAHKDNTISSPGFFGQRFNNLQQAALLTSFWRHWFNMTKFFPNLVNGSWLKCVWIKNNCCSFERLFKVKKNDVFLFGISFFVLSGLHMANLSSQTRVGKLASWCVWTAQKQAANTFANCWCQIETCLPTVFMPFTRTNLSLPTWVYQL